MVGGARPKSLRAQSCPTAAAPPYAGPAALLPCRKWGRDSRLRQSPRQRCFTVRLRGLFRQGAGRGATFNKFHGRHFCQGASRSTCSRTYSAMLLSPPPAPRRCESMILGVLWGGIRLVGIDVGLGSSYWSQLVLCGAYS